MKFELKHMKHLFFPIKVLLSLVNSVVRVIIEIETTERIDRCNILGLGVGRGFVQATLNNQPRPNRDKHIRPNNDSTGGCPNQQGTQHQ